MKKSRLIAPTLVGLFLLTGLQSARAQEAMLGEVRLFAGNFAPRGWALCDGQMLPISQNSALFSLLGTNYGGDGRTTFGLPDLRGRVPLHVGRGPGLTPRRLGQKGGSESVTPRTAVANGVADGGQNSGVAAHQDVPVMQPYLGLNFIICLQGVFPSRN